MPGADTTAEGESRRTRRHELGAFLFVTIVLAPLLSIVVIGGYGLIIWITHLLGGPPGLPVD